MKKLLFILSLSVAVTGLYVSWSSSAWAQQSIAPAPLVGPLSPLSTQLGQTLQTLVGASSAQPTNGTDMNEDSAGQITDTFATDLLNSLGQMVEEVKKDSTSLMVNLSAWPDFTDWLARQSSDPRRQALWSDIGNDLLVIVGVPLLSGIALSLLLLPLRLNLRRKQPDSLAGRVGLLLGLFLLRLIPVFIFLGAALTLLDQNEVHRLPRFVILNVIYALTAGYATRQILRGVFAPTTEYLRLFPLSTPRAVYSCNWLSAFGILIIYGYFLTDIATALHVPASTLTAFQNVFALVLTVMTIIVILQTRTSVAAILRGAEGEDTKGFTVVMRGWLARQWHSLTITYLIISLIVTVLGIDNGIALMLRGTILTFVILVGSRLCFLALDQWRTPSNGIPALLHRQILSFLLRPFVWLGAAAALVATWGVHLSPLFASSSGQRVLDALLSIGMTLFVLTLLYEFINASIERQLTKRDSGNKLIASPRARTLLPMVRNSIFLLFSAVAILICLSAVGVNIAPLLAGAGVIGVAVGFGSQTLVKDFLTGLFIVAENTIAVGDIVKIDSFCGVVETLSIRTIRLRDDNGTLHILPFGEVSKISNMSKGYAYALVDIGVSYDSDLEHVMNVLREIGAQIQEDPIFKRVVLEPIEVMGVEKLGDSSVTLRARIRTRPGKQFDIKRLLLLRIKERFDKEKIEMPFPTIVHIAKTVD